MSRATIFIVEDEGIVAADIADRLTGLGYKVAGIAATQAEALEKIVATKPDLVLMDIQLRGSGDGVETAEKLQSLHRVPVVYLTANSDPKTFQRAKITQPFGYLLKPFDERLLEINIEVALHNHMMEMEREKLLKQLQDAVDQVNVLHGLLPICASCKKIRDDKGYWSQLEIYLSAHGNVNFTHGICPECARHWEEQMNRIPPAPKKD